MHYQEGKKKSAPPYYTEISRNGFVRFFLERESYLRMFKDATARNMRRQSKGWMRQLAVAAPPLNS